MDSSSYRLLFSVTLISRGFVCLILLEFGADKSQLNRQYLSAWDLAGNNESISEVFKNHSGICKNCKHN